MTSQQLALPTLQLRAHKRPVLLLIAAVAIALAIRLLVVAFVLPSFLVPEREHWLFGFEQCKIAQSIVLGHGFGNLYYGGSTGPTAQIGPVLPYIMAGIFELFGIYTKASAFVILGLNSLFSALTCIPVYFIAQKSFGDRVGRWATWGWAFFPYAIYFSADSMWDHALVTFLVTCIFWLALLLPEPSRTRNWATFGALCGFTALVNPTVLSVGVVLGAWACWRLRLNGNPTPRLKPVATAAALAMAVMAPWLVRNYSVFHKPVFIKDNLPLAFAVGNFGDSLYWWNGTEHPSGSAAQMAEFDRLGELPYMAEKRRQAIAYIEQEPWRYVLRSCRRMIYMWTGFWSFNSKYLQEENFDLYNIPFCVALTALGLLGLRAAFQRQKKYGLPFGLVLLVFPVVYYLTEPDMAYRHPLDPEMVILVAYVIACWRIEKHAEPLEEYEEVLVASEP